MDKETRILSIDPQKPFGKWKNYTATYTGKYVSERRRAKYNRNPVIYAYRRMLLWVQVQLGLKSRYLTRGEWIERERKGAEVVEKITEEMLKRLGRGCFTDLVDGLVPRVRDGVRRRDER